MVTFFTEIANSIIGKSADSIPSHITTIDMDAPDVGIDPYEYLGIDSYEFLELKKE